MKSAVTISLVPESKGGPFVFSDGLEEGFARAAKFGFNAVGHLFEDAQNFYNGKPRWLRFSGFYVDDPASGPDSPSFVYPLP